MIALIDYGVGNLYSVEKALKFVGGEVQVTSNAADLRHADKLVLPGVGAFGDCMKNLEATGLIPTILEQVLMHKPLLGICVGLQILFERSEESPEVKGLGVFKGEVKKIRADGLKIPHMGWNSIQIGRKDNLIKFGASKLLAGLEGKNFFYFVHSYHAVPANENLVTAITNYGENVTAAVELGKVFATQFHPEKSGDVGLKVLKNFVEM
ncbi:MAG: imidazole glycerol phosphate synthase subunit HisH [Selenomonadaceae bacterium]|nr:imidazole glycerol phosphate synthase subunit HisH [Selenomonadaceae bacterium]